MVLLDKNATTQEILQQIQEIQNGPELEQAELEFKPNFTNRVDLSEADYSQIAQDSGISDTTFNRMAADTYHQEGGYFQKKVLKLKAK